MAVSAQEASTKGKPDRSRHFALVMNDRAGGLIGQANGTKMLENQLQAAGGTVVVIPPDAGTLPERIAEAKATQADCIVIAGGDGSIACAATALAGTGTALGLIPSGTMNLLAKDLGIDPADPGAAVRILLEGTTRRIDVGALEDEIFLCASMLGTPARLSRHREAGRARGNGVRAWAGFASAALRALLQNRAHRYVLRFDGQELRLRSPSITITVNRLDDGTARLFGRSNLNGGELAVYVVRRGNVLSQALLLLRTVLTGRLREPDIQVFTTRALEVDAPHAAVHVLLDGELRVLTPPLRYTIRPGALSVIARG